MATDGLSVSGQAEAGATVTIRDSSNTVLGSAVANGNGQFIVPLNTAQTNGQALIATATDVAKTKAPPRRLSRRTVPRRKCRKRGN